VQYGYGEAVRNSPLLRIVSGLLAFALMEPALHGKEPPRLKVAEGQFVFDGQPRRLFGVNYFTAFSWALGVEDGSKQAGEKKTFREGFHILSEKGIPFARFNCGGFFPKDWKLYREDPARYFALLDELVREAESRKLGLIPSLFWSFFTVPGITGEPISAWGDPASKTHAFMKKYVGEVVGRYKDSPAILGWEFGNEYGLEADLPAEQQAGLARWFQPEFGMPSKLGPGDHLTSAMIRTAYSEFAKAVRKIDAERPVFTGDTSPRSSAASLEKTGNWGSDTVDEWITQLIKNNPDPVDTLSIHFYPFHKEAGVGLAKKPFEETLDASIEASKRSGKPLWIGEFAGSEIPDAALRREQFQKTLDLLVARKVQLTAVWVFDYPNQPFMNIDIGTLNERMLDAIVEANRQR